MGAVYHVRNGLSDREEAMKLAAEADAIGHVTIRRPIAHRRKPLRVMNASMSDRLYLSCWVRGYSFANMLRHFETMLGLFPFSKLARRGALMHIYAVEYSEPAVADRDFSPGVSAAEIVAAAGEFVHEDCAVEVEAEWDLWQHGDQGWELRPAPVRLLALGPDFENENGDHLRIELGLDALYLPQEGIEGTLRMSQSNLKSLLHLVNDVERTLPLERRLLWSESGVNFPALLAETLARMEAN